jgi:hypothetical protein
VVVFCLNYIKRASCIFNSATKPFAKGLCKNFICNFHHKNLSKAGISAIFVALFLLLSFWGREKYRRRAALTFLNLSLDIV